MTNTDDNESAKTHRPLPPVDPNESASIPLVESRDEDEEDPANNADGEVHQEPEDDDPPPREYSISPYLIHLYKYQQFYAALSRRLSRKCTTRVPTMGVHLKGGRPNLLFNPEFLASLKSNEVIAALKHEFYHLVLGHVTDSRSNTDREENQKLWNWATDLAINSHLSEENLPGLPLTDEEIERLKDPAADADDIFVPLKPGSYPFEDWPDKKAADWYYNSLKDLDPETRERLMDMLGESAGIDSHPWGGASKADRKIAEGVIDKMREDAAKEAAKSGWGDVPQEIQETIQDLLQPSQVPWEAVLEGFVQTVRSDEYQYTRRRPNRKTGLIHPGKRKQNRAEIAVAVDQSGSMSDDELAAIGSELNELARHTSFTVFAFDTEVDEDSVFKWDKGVQLSEIERHRKGGTDFDAPTQWVNRHGGRFDGMILCTDMCAPKPKPAHCPRLWVKTGGYDPDFQTNEPVIEVDH